MWNCLGIFFTLFLLHNYANLTWINNARMFSHFITDVVNQLLIIKNFPRGWWILHHWSIRFHALLHTESIKSSPSRKENENVSTPWKVLERMNFLWRITDDSLSFDEHAQTVRNIECDKRNEEFNRSLIKAINIQRACWGNFCVWVILENF